MAILWRKQVIFLVSLVKNSSVLSKGTEAKLLSHKHRSGG